MSKGEVKNGPGSTRLPSSNTGGKEATGIEDSARPSSSNSQRREAMGETGCSQDGSESSSIVQHKPIRIVFDTKILSVALLADGLHFVTGDEKGKVRRWRIEDGEEVGTPMFAEGAVRCIAPSQDGRWIVAGTDSCQLCVWDANTHQEVSKFTLGNGVDAVDASPDRTKIAVAMDGFFHVRPNDGTLLSRWCRIESIFHTVKFSPDGCLLCIGAEDGNTSVLQIHNTSDSKRFFALSSDANIFCVDASDGETLSKWAIHSNDNPTCISLSGDGAFIAASANTSVSFWDTSTRQQIGCVIRHPHSVSSVAISPNYDLVIAGNPTIALWDLLSILSPSNDQKQEILGAALKDANTHSQLADAQHAAKQKEKLTTEFVDHPLVIRAYRQKHQCETLYADGHVIDAAKSLLNFIKSINDDLESETSIKDWLSAFTNKCVAALEQIGDEASRTRKDDEALAAYAIARSLCPSSSNTFLNKCARTMLLRGSTNKILDDARDLELPKFGVYCAICDVLEGDGRVTEAIECFRQMQRELTQSMHVGNERARWEFDFQRRCAKRLEKLADVALGSQSYDKADKLYSLTLSLDPLNRADVLSKRSKTRMLMNRWNDALGDADEVIKLNASSHLGYEQRHAALRGLERHEEAGAAYDTMLLKLKEAPNMHVRELRSRCAEVMTTIRSTIHATISSMPRILIDTTTGRLNDRTQRVKAFEELPIFNELVSSMTNKTDCARIQREVKSFYRYVMFSHKWEHLEPLFQEVEGVTVYKLEATDWNVKLQKFCSLVHSLGFQWAWSDTCCIDREKDVVLQESLVAMFRWYRGSSLTIIHLRDVSSEEEEPDGVRRSIWNTRVWTFQEYVAAQRVMFYTNDWKPYLGLTLENHKESPIIQREMEMSQVSSEQVAVLRPGFDRIREKLYLASTREATLVEDIAYSLIGILNATIPIIYGEGTRAVGRLLGFVLTGSGDATILAWTGTANEYNSCLPLDLTVYNPLVPPHIPRMETAELDHAVTELQSSLPDASLAVKLYCKLNDLASPSVASSRLRLPGIVFPITDVSMSGLDPQVYCATTGLSDDIEIKTISNLETMNGLYLVHPWIRPLLDREFAQGSTSLDATTQALRLLARLQQPFGALLFEQVSRTEYKRVAADSLIMVQFRKEVSLTDLISSVRTIEVL